MKHLALAFALGLFILPWFSVAAYDPATIIGQHGGGVCGLDVNGNAGTRVSDTGSLYMYYNGGGAVAGLDPAVFPPGFFDEPSHYCFEETETWFNLGSSLGGDTVNNYGWVKYNAPYVADANKTSLYPTAYPNNRNIKENWSFSIGGGPVTVALVANPTSIVTGEQSLLTWSSTGATSCTGTNFNTNGAVSGSVLVAPLSTTKYTVSCTGAGGSATAETTVLVSSATGPVFDVTCRAHPTQAGVGEDVLWSSTVTGGEGTYAYEWSGSESLSGTGNQVFKKYAIPGTKTARLKVTYTPNQPPSSGGQSGSGSRSQSCGPVSDPGVWTGIDCMAGESTFGLDCPAGQMISCEAADRTLSCNGGPGQGLNPYTDTGRLCRCAVDTSCTTPSPTPPAVTIPKPVACPAIGFVMPLSPCSGSWAPTYSSDGCQSGWQCAAIPSGSGGYVPEPEDASLTDYLFDFFQYQDSFDSKATDIQTVDGTVLGATASTVQHTEGELFTSAPTVKQDMLQNGGVSFTETTFVGRTFSADQTTMNRVCAVLHGAGSTATNIGARGYSSCGNNQNFQFSGGMWAVVSGCTYAHISGSFSCLVPAPAPTPGQCTLSVSPSVVQAGQSAILSWVTTNLSSLTLGNGIGSVTPVSSGSRVVTPGVTTMYSGTGVSSDSSTNYSIQSAHSSIISVMTQDTAKYGIAYNTSYGIYADPTTITHICEQVFGPGAVQQQYDVTAFNSCGNNQILKWDGTRWVAFGACQDNRKMLYVLDCKVPQVSTAPPVQCGGNATITVVPRAANPEVIEVDCENSVRVRIPQCSDGIDNDGDGDIDTDQDGGCGSDDDDDEGNEDNDDLPQCSDGMDNDGDTQVDYPVDPGCVSPQDDDERNTTPPQCSDGIDNDGDGLSDRNDPDCYTGGGGSGGGGSGGGGTYNPNGGSESGGGSGAKPQCSDDIDNNGDGNVDWPDDPGCSSPSDELELGGPADVTLAANPPLIKKNQQCTLSLAARNVASCSLTGLGISRTFTATGGVVSATEVLTPSLTQTAAYTLSCRGLDGKIVSKKIDCKIAPTFEEI